MTEPTAPMIDEALLRRQLASAGLDTTWAGYRTEFIGRFSNDIWLLELSNGIRLLAKQSYRPARPHDHPDVERQFYRWMDARHDLPIPRYFGEVDGILLIEYLPLQPFSFGDGASQDHAERAIDTLADWHAAWWGNPPAADWLPNYANLGERKRIQENFDYAWTRHKEKLLEAAPEFRPVGDALVGNLTRTLEPMAEPGTLIHGDAHAENLVLTEHGDVFLLDWQDPWIANPGLDLAVFTTMSFREQDRASIERQLVERHASRLAGKGCNWPDPWRDYRLGLLRRAARIVEIADLDFPSLSWVFRRSAMAAIDHKVVDLIL